MAALQSTKDTLMTTNSNHANAVALVDANKWQLMQEWQMVSV